jgi:hypothetical protein
MPIQRPRRVLIFDSTPDSVRRNAVSQIVRGADLRPEVVDDLELAERRLGLGGIGAVISTHDERLASPGRSNYQAQHLLGQAASMRIPIALISNGPVSHKQVGLDPEDRLVVVPSGPPAVAASALRGWLLDPMA